MQPLAADLDGFHPCGKRTEIVRFLADQTRFDVLLNNRNKILRQKQRIAPACAGILYRRAVAVSDLAVLQDQHDRDRLACLTDGGKALGDRLADIEHPVVPRAALDRALVVKIEAGTSGCADNIFDFHK